MNNTQNKKYFIKTFGCQMNQYDSLLIGEELEEYGYSLTNDIKKADLILFNTCAVRGLAEHKAVSELGSIKKLKTKKPDILVGMIGCVAQKLGKDLAKKYKFVDFVLGTKDMYKISEFLKNKDFSSNSKTIVKTNLDYVVKGYSSKKINSVSAYLTVVRGCTNFCSYCIVPYVRGEEQSRSILEILEEVQVLANNGVQEIVLLGQNVNIYGLDIGTNLQNLLLEINNIDEIKRIRYLTSHPMSVNQQFIEIIKNIPKVAKHIHIPFQSGSNKILKQMNRKYTREEYIQKVEEIKKVIPDIGITADIIVGFPGETEDDFLDTLTLLEICKLDNVYSFKYSPREGTKAFETLREDVLKEEKEDRLERVHKVNEKIALEINKNLIGKYEYVLWESVKNYKNKKMIEGRTSSFKKIFANVNVEENRVGEIDKVKILKGSVNSLFGEIV